jgi:5'-3' exonuclease
MLLDTSSLFYRAYFALPPSITDAYGAPVNAVHGYLDMTARLISAHRPDDVVHVWDHDWRPAPRVVAYPPYKANRPPDPEALTAQWPVLREALDASGLPQAEAPGWEADDAIGTLSARVAGEERVDIVTGDRDLIQLVRDPFVRALFTRRGVAELDALDEAAVRAKHGVSPNAYAFYACLRGDPSDGLPGVKGVGEKTARALVLAYGHLDALLEDAARETPEREPLRRSPRLAAAVREAAQYLATMQHVASVRTDVSVREWRDAPDSERLDRLAQIGGIAGPLRRLEQALGRLRGGDERADGG